MKSISIGKKPFIVKINYKTLIGFLMIKKLN